MNDHLILNGIEGVWPALLGLNEVEIKEDNQIKTILSGNIDGKDYPLLVISSAARIKLSNSTFLDE